MSDADRFETRARAFIASRRAAGTRYLYTLRLDDWLTHCKAAGVHPANPTLAQAAAYREALGARELGPGTIRRALTNLSAIYGDAVTEHPPAAHWNPFLKLPKPRVGLDQRTEAIAAPVARKLLQAAEDYAETDRGRDAAVLRLLYDTGLRRGSVAALRRDRIVRRGALTVIRVPLKGGADGEVELSDQAAAALERWLSASSGPYVFPGRVRASLHPSGVNRILVTYAAELGLKGRHHPHQFRAAFVTDALDAGLALHEVQAAVQDRKSVV